MNCHLCHGANPESKAGGLSTRAWKDLMDGGNLGPVIMAGDPERSPLYQFISGARGEPHRMPLGGPPLDPLEVETIRRWIAEGARVDANEPKPYWLTLRSVPVNRTTPINLRARIPVTAYISLEVTDSHGKLLYLDGGAVQPKRGVAAIGATGEWIS